ncbi:Phage portal protein, HK97 [gut metagenome]|uniref:Phage portal protein, HK97 n=1 Tax=gut metagenome TaxID=749906 RepID=J9GQV2_9ZZZZ
MIDLFGGDAVGTMGAMQVSTVFACVRILSESVASLPLEVMDINSRKEVYEPATKLPLYYVLTTAPNEHTSAFDFWSSVVQEMLLEGNAYIIPEYDPVVRGVARLTLCRRGTVTYDAMTNLYTVNDMEQNVQGTFTEEEVIHLKNVTLDGKHGLSTLKFARLTSRIAVQGDQETLSRFENGGNIRGIVSNDNGVRGFGEYQDAELDRAARDLDADFDSQRIVSLPGGVDFQAALPLFNRYAVSGDPEVYRARNLPFLPRAACLCLR